jgi:hypothetical protein
MNTPLTSEPHFNELTPDGPADDLDESDEDMTDVAEELRWQEFDAQLQEDRHNERR